MSEEARANTGLFGGGNWIVATVCSERERHTKDIYAAEAAPWQEHVRFHFPILLFLLLREEDIRKRKISLHIDDRH